MGLDKRSPGVSVSGRQRVPGPVCGEARVLQGSMPAPLLSSLGRQWNGVAVELHRFHDLDTRVECPEQVVAVHVAGNVTVHQTRGGCTCSHTMRPGDVTLTPPGPPVRWSQAGLSVVILVRLSAEYVRTIAGDDHAMDPDQFEVQPMFARPDARIDRLANALLAGLELEGMDSHTHADRVACALTMHLLRRYTRMSAVDRWPKARLSSHNLRRAVQFIEDNIGRPLTLASIARVVSLSPGHFAHAFRQATGVAPHRFLVERRVERAKALLRHSDLPISEIADRIGCSSNSHFSVLFHRVTGITPREFRALGHTGTSS